MSNRLFNYLCFLCFLPMFIIAQTKSNITSDSSLTAGDGSSLVSPSGDFAFGFKEVSTGGFLLAIWFNKIAEQTITWSANRNQLAQIGSVLQLTVVGKLSLNDPDGNEIWAANVSSNGVSSIGTLLDTGNFALYSKNLDVLWQSFDHPTDTILPSQSISQGVSLIAPVSNRNYSDGRFQLIMQSDGSLVFNILNWPENTISYLAYETISTGGNGIELAFNNQSGVVNIAAQNGSVVAAVFTNQVSEKLFYQRAVLEFDGVFRKYAYPRTSSTGIMNWTVQDFLPQDICSISQLNGNRGGGACGFNSYCQTGNDQRPECLCPEGYSFIDETDQMKGCKPDVDLESCSQETNQFRLVQMSETNFWGSDYETYNVGQTDASCQAACLSDCLCAAVVFNTADVCWKKRFPLSNGWKNSSVIQGTVTYIKLRSNGGIKVEKHKNLILVESILLGGSGFLNVVFIILAVFTANYAAHKWKTKDKQQDITGTNMRNFSYYELTEATNGFKEVIGQGAFSTIYKGSLDFEEGKAIAVKKLNQLEKENQREFESEVRAIARTGHRNLVQLIGFCNEEKHRLLVYKYMPNGSLADVLFHDPRPSWFTRIKFAFETARGLNYLHEECSIQIIHCDIKPQNVLLDENLTVNISDFGLAKLLKKDQTHTITGIRGTKGYVAPEWFKSMPVTTKVDVYSYGVLLLELICCRRCFIADIEDESQMVLADWAYDCYKEGRIEKLVEHDNEAMSDLEKVKKLVLLALWCVHDVPSARPSMRKVVQMIEGGAEELLPPDLVFSSLSYSTECFSDA